MIKKTLNLKVFFTAGKEEAKSWLTKKEEKAKTCAGLIHTDMEKNFIAVEVYSYNEWEQTPNLEELKKTGKIRKEGAEYVIQDGDICQFFLVKTKKTTKKKEITTLIFNIKKKQQNSAFFVNCVYS